MPTVLDALLARQPTLNASSVPPGGNTRSNFWIPVDGWRPWEDFTYENLFSMYRKVLTASWDNPPSIDINSFYDQQMCDERILEFNLVRFMFPTINAAFQIANRVLQRNPDAINLGSGTWSGTADWGLISYDRMFEGTYLNLLPGDTKVSAKWYPEMERSSKGNEREEWSLPVSQVTTYMSDAACRYGFIITDLHLVVLRISKEYVGRGLAAGRPQRQHSQPSHQRVASGSTDLSHGMDAMSLDSFGAASYDDTHPGSIDFQFPEYAVIPWSAHGKGKLTIKLALFCLSFMASGGNASIESGYPPLDSWMKQDAGLFIHNTPGFPKKNLPSGASLVNPQHSPSSSQSQSPVEPRNDYILVEAQEKSGGRVRCNPEEGETFYTQIEDWEECHTDQGVFWQFIDEHGQYFWAHNIEAAPQSQSSGSKNSSKRERKHGSSSGRRKGK